jgi:signal transduction histidine kinase
MLAGAAHDAEHLRLLRALGLRSTLLVPLIAHDRTIGMLTFVHAESGRRFRTDDIALATELARRAATAVENAHLYMRLREEDRRKDEFLATLAHELRNPLAPLTTGIELMRLTGDPKNERTRVVMERQLRHLVRLVDDLLDVSRVTRGKVTLRPESLDVASVVSTAVDGVRPLIEKAGLELAVSLPAPPISITADRTRVAQILGNLLTNAAKYTEPGGKVSIAARRDGDHIVFEVSDTGIGIPTEMQTQIFEMFVQVPRSYEQRQGGLGIGLTLVRRLVELHGGQVWCVSEGVGKGSTFVVRLPHAHEAVHEHAPSVRREPRKQRSILLVDDNVDAIETLSALLRHDGHDVRTAATGPDALELVREFVPDIALLDIGLPGMSGYELARRLREDPRLGDLTLVAVTGWGQPEDRRQSREAGFNHHFTKPVDARDLQSLFD